MKNNIKAINEVETEGKFNKYDSERLSFLSHISHGIRTPLNAIMGFSKLLALKDPENKKQEQYIRGILSGGNLLMQFVDNVMDLSQFEADNYSLRIDKYDLNQIIWEFTEDYYNHKFENKDTDISLMIVWDSKIDDLIIETDKVLLKKSIQRLLNIVSKKYPINEYELGYRNIENACVSFFIRPAIEKLDVNDLINKHQLYSVDNNDSFDFFNYKVLSQSVKMLKGSLSSYSDMQEYSFCIPLKFKGNKTNKTGNYE